jgi:excisionase family DNA binding protein
VLHSPDIDPLAALRDLERSSFTPTIAAEVLPRLLNLAASLARASALPTPASEPDDALLDVHEVAARLGVSESTVYERRAEIGGVKIGAAVRFSRGALKEYMAGSRADDDDALRDRSGGVVNPMPRRLRTA